MEGKSVKHLEPVKSSSDSNLFDNISHPNSTPRPSIYDPLLNSSSYSECISSQDARIPQVELGWDTEIAHEDIEYLMGRSETEEVGNMPMDDFVELSFPSSLMTSSWSSNIHIGIL